MRTPAGATLIVGGIMIAAAYGPLLIEHFANLSAKSYYQHFPFILAAFAWLAWQRFTSAQPRRADAHNRFAGLEAALLAGFAWISLALAYLTHSPSLGYVSFVVFVAAALVAAASYRKAAGLPAVWLLLWLLVPPPFNYDQKLIAYLQRISSRASSFVLDFLGVTHLMEGNMLTLPGKQFFVDEACSGIISVMSIIACAAIYGVWRRSSAAHVLVLIAAGVAWATVMNTFRITSIAYLYAGWGVDWSEGTPHEALSLCVFMLTFVALMSSDVLLRGLLAPIESAWEEHHDEPLRCGRWLAVAWDAALGHRPSAIEESHEALPPATHKSASAAWSWPIRIALPLLFLALPVCDYARGRQTELVVIPGAGDGAAATARAMAIQKAFLPERIGALRQERFDMHERARDDELGNHSRSHTYVDSRGNVYMVSCDFAYEGGWHELTLCYQGIGWRLDERVVSDDLPARDGAPWPRMEADFSKDAEGAKAFVVASTFDEVGNRIAMPTWSVWEHLQSTLRRDQRVTNGSLGFQTQVWITSDAPIGEHQREAARLLLAEAREQFRTLVVGDPAHPPGATNPATASSPLPSVAEDLPK